MARDLPLELVFAILKRIKGESVFEACLESGLFRIDDVRDVHAWRRCGTTKKHVLVREGDLDALQHMYRRRRARFFWQDVSLAAASGRLDTVQWLWHIVSSPLPSTDNHLPLGVRGHPQHILAHAACSGNIRLVEWISERISPPAAIDVANAMDAALGEGHADIVRLLYRMHANKGTSGGLARAAVGGHIECMQAFVSLVPKARHLFRGTLYRLCREAFPATDDLSDLKQIEKVTLYDMACAHGHIALAQWLYDSQLSCPDDAVALCVALHIARAEPAIEFARQLIAMTKDRGTITGYSTDVYTERIARHARSLRDRDVGVLLMDMIDMPERHALLFAVRWNDRQTFERIVHLFPDVFREHAAECLAEASRHGHSGLVWAILERLQSAFYAGRALNDALVNGHVGMAYSLLVRRKCTYAPANMLVEAIAQGRFESVRFLFERNYYVRDAMAFTRAVAGAISARRYDILEYMCSHAGQVDFASVPVEIDTFGVFTKSVVAHASVTTLDALVRAGYALRPYLFGHAIAHGRVDMIDFLWSNRARMPLVHDNVILLDGSADTFKGRKSVRALDRLEEHTARDDVKMDWSPCGLPTNAIKQGDIPVAKWFHERGLLPLDLSNMCETLAQVALAGHLTMVEWLCKDVCLNAPRDLVLAALDKRSDSTEAWVRTMHDPAVQFLRAWCFLLAT